MVSTSTPKDYTYENNIMMLVIVITILIMMIGCILIYNLWKRRGPVWGDEHLPLEDHAAELEEDDETFALRSLATAIKEAETGKGEQKKEGSMADGLLKSVLSVMVPKTKAGAGKQTAEPIAKGKEITKRGAVSASLDSKAVTAGQAELSSKGKGGKTTSPKIASPGVKMAKAAKSTSDKRPSPKGKVTKMIMKASPWKMGKK